MADFLQSTERVRARPRPLSRFLRASLPPSLPEIDGLQFETLYLPCADSLIGGDWYDVLALPDGSVAVVVGDVAGHGAEAAAIMGKIRYSMRVIAMRTNAIQLGGAASIFPLVEAGLRGEHPDASATAFLGIISADRTRMQYAIAGHPPPIAVKRSGDTEWLEAGEPPLGCGYDRARRNHLIGVRNVQRLILYTDGLIESGRNVITGLERLQSVLQDPNISGTKELLPRVIEATLVAKPHDDIAMLAVTFD